MRGTTSMVQKDFEQSVTRGSSSAGLKSFDHAEFVKLSQEVAVSVRISGKVLGRLSTKLVHSSHRNLVFHIVEQSMEIIVEDTAERDDFLL